jgi:hypothetical protein
LYQSGSNPISVNAVHEQSVQQMTFAPSARFEDDEVAVVLGHP